MRNWITVAVVLAVGLFAAQAFRATAQGRVEPQARAPAVTKWEYKVFSGSLRTANNVTGLNNLGDEGWEVAAVGQEAAITHVILKRPKQ